jgi:flavin reductase (DIM6/NTAB) family NADH-FMN oxidoreductase RutF
MDREEFDRFVAGLAAPLHVVTAATADERAGCLVGFGAEVGFDPPRYLVCISDKNRTHAIALETDLLAVHLPAADQHDLAELFGGETGDEVDKFAHWPWRPGPGGVPILADVPRVMVGRVLERHDWGDHTAHLLEPLEVEVRPGTPGLRLTDVEDIEPGHEA